jgi:hypothetical protein
VGKCGIYLFAGLVVIGMACGVFVAAVGKDKGEQEGTKPCDVRLAEDLWMEIKGYRTWPPPKGFEGWQEGQSPHGKFLRYYVNDIGQEDPTKDGTVIVKANYTEASYDALASLTVMQKRQGYDPENADWFYVQYSPDGKIMTDDRGQKIAGPVGKGTDAGCVPCHKSAPGGDYLFMTK